MSPLALPYTDSAPSIMHKLKLQPSSFEKIKAGVKTIEMRLWDDKRRGMQVGDKITFYKLPEQAESLTCSIKALHVFPHFTAMCDALPLDKMGYEGPSLHAWLKRRDPGMAAYYAKADEAKYGVVGIEIEVEHSLKP